MEPRLGFAGGFREDSLGFSLVFGGKILGCRVPEDFLINQSIEDLLHSFDSRCLGAFGRKNKVCPRKLGLNANLWLVQKRNVDSVVLRNGMNWQKNHGRNELNIIKPCLLTSCLLPSSSYSDFFFPGGNSHVPPSAGILKPFRP